MLPVNAYCRRLRISQTAPYTSRDRYPIQSPKTSNKLKPKQKRPWTCRWHRRLYLHNNHCLHLLYDRNSLIPIFESWRFSMPLWPEEPLCFQSSAPSPAIPAPSLAEFLRNCLPRLIPEFVSRRIATYFTYFELMDSPSFAWPTTRSEVCNHRYLVLSFFFFSCFDFFGFVWLIWLGS